MGRPLCGFGFAKPYEGLREDSGQQPCQEARICLAQWRDRRSVGPRAEGEGRCRRERGADCPEPCAPRGGLRAGLCTGWEPEKGSEPGRAVTLVDGERLLTRCPRSLLWMCGIQSSLIGPLITCQGPCGVSRRATLTSIPSKEQACLRALPWLASAPTEPVQGSVLEMLHRA